MSEEPSGQELAALPRKRQGGARVDLFFGPAEAEELVVFHHIPKTAGTSLKRLVASQPDTRSEEAWTPGFDHGLPLRDPDGVRDFYGRLWQRLDRERLAFVTSHSANFLLELADRPAFAVTIVRKPADRIGSLYAFRNRRSPLPNEPTKLLESMLSLGEIYERFGGATPRSSETHRLAATYFNGQARSLLAPIVDTSELAFVDRPPPDADRWRKLLRRAMKQYDLLGTRERFKDFVEVLASRYGWSVRRVPRAKQNLGRKTPSDEELELAGRYNWLDRELYKSCARRWS